MHPVTPFRLAAALALSTVVGACAPAINLDNAPGDDDSDAAALEADLPTSPTAVRVALFDDEDNGVGAVNALRAWPAWFVAEGDTNSFVLVGERFTFEVRDAGGVLTAASDVEFGAPQSGVVVNGVAAPVVLVVDADADLTAVATLGALPPTQALGVSSYLGFAEGALTIDTVNADTGESSSTLTIPLSTVGAYVDGAPALTTATLR